MTSEPQVFAESSDGVVTLRFDESLYPRDVVFGAAYVLLDRAYVHVDRQADKLVVVVRAKSGVQLDSAVVAGEFENEALSQAWRQDVLRENRAIVEGMAAKALAGAAGPPGLDDLLEGSMGELGDAFDDPLGIAVSWEEKYGKQDQGKVEAPAASPQDKDLVPTKPAPSVDATAATAEEGEAPSAGIDSQAKPQAGKPEGAGS